MYASVTRNQHIRSLQSVPPHESEVAASRGRRHIELQNEEHRSEKRRDERARGRERRETSRTRQERRNRDKAVLSNSCIVSTDRCRVRPRSSSLRYSNFCGLVISFYAWHIYHPQWHGEGVDTLDGRPTTTTTTMTPPRVDGAFDTDVSFYLYQVLTWRLRSHTYIYASTGHAYV